MSVHFNHEVMNASLLRFNPIGLESQCCVVVPKVQLKNDANVKCQQFQGIPFHKKFASQLHESFGTKLHSACVLKFHKGETAQETGPSFDDKKCQMGKCANENFCGSPGEQTGLTIMINLQLTPGAQQPTNHRDPDHGARLGGETIH